MFYNTHSEVYAAESTDGETWTKLGKIGIHGADVDGYYQEDGSIRIYYGDFSEETSGVVYTVVLVAPYTVPSTTIQQSSGPE